MHAKPSKRTLTLSRETLRRLDEQILRRVAGGAPTQGAPCDRSAATDCATCACPPPP